jgi:hypothetical protein
MTDKQTGGAAFPQFVLSNGGACVEGGMNLRDYFAAKAMQGLMGWSTRVGCPDEALAHDAYALADAILKAREA